VQVLFRKTYWPVADRNCVAVRWGGKQRKATGSSVAEANSIRPVRLASLPRKGEAQTCESRINRKPMTLRVGDKAIMGADRWLETEGLGRVDA
jgi:hypothetical protein